MIYLIKFSIKSNTFF